MQPMIICFCFCGKVIKFDEGIVSYSTKCEAPRFCCDSYQVALWQPTLGGAPEANCLARFVFRVFLCFCLHYCLYFVYLRVLAVLPDCSSSFLALVPKIYINITIQGSLQYIAVIIVIFIKTKDVISREFLHLVRSLTAFMPRDSQLFNMT